MLNKDRFFARRDILELINKRVLSFIQGYRQNIAVLGDELVGKSSVVRYFLDNHLPPGVIPIYISIDSLQIDCFVKRFCGSLLYNFLQLKGIRPSNELEYLITKSQEYIPQTVAKIRSIISNLGQQKTDAIFQMLFDLPAIFTAESQSLCLVILDEFHNLEDLKAKNIFQELGKRIMLQKKVMYLFVSSFRAKAKKIIEDELSLLFGNFENIGIEPFDNKTADDFIVRNLPDVNIADTYKEFIINLCGGSPYYLDLFCQELIFISKLKDKTTLSLEDVIDVLENLLFNPLGRLNARFDSKLHIVTSCKGGNCAADILLAISSGFNKFKEVAVNLNKAKKDIIQKVNRLTELNLISQNGAFYKINDKVFGLWLKTVYKIRRDSFIQDADNLRDSFRRELQMMFDFLLGESRKKSTERIIELFNLFKDDSILMESRRIKLADFKEIRFFGFGGNDIRMLIIAKDRQDTLWITFLKEDMVTEDDVIEFARHIKHNESRIKRKIVIGLSQIDPNARLKALKEKMLIWDRRNVNQLFELYGKPIL